MSAPLVYAPTAGAEAVAIGLPGSEDRTQAVLLARARRLAERPTEPATHASVDVLEFSADGARWAVEARWVRGIHPLRGLTPLPCVPAAVLGLVTVRGRIVPVLRLAALPGLQAGHVAEPTLTNAAAADGDAGASGASIVLLQSGDVELAIPADDAGAVRPLDLALLQPRPGKHDDNSAHAAAWVRGVTTEGRTLLDVPALLADPRLLVDEMPDSGNTEETS